MAAGKEKLLLLATRIHTLEPRTTENLDNFLSAFRKVGRYRLDAWAWCGDFVLPTQIESGIVLDRFHIAPAWQIDDLSVDMLGLRSGDHPVVPDGI